jgi:Putative zinc-finger
LADAVMAAALVQFDHDYVEHRRVAERYVAGGLTRPEQAWFERHVRHCEECADDVELAELFGRSRDFAARKIKGENKGIFQVLAAFRPAQQWTIFGAAALLLLAMPALWITRPPVVEHVIALQRSGNTTIAPPHDGNPFVIVAETFSASGRYRLSIVDLSSRTLWQGHDWDATAGVALGLQVPSLPPGFAFAIVERKVANGSYMLMARYPIFVQ